MLKTRGGAMFVNRSLSLVVALAACAILFVLPLADDARPACDPTSCGVGIPPRGDLNLDASVDAIDLSELIQYCFNPAHPPFAAPLCNAEVNGVCNRWYPCEPTLGDVTQLIDFLFFAQPLSPTCLVPDITVGPLRVRGARRVPPGTGQVTFWAYAYNRAGPTRRLFGYTLPIRVFGPGVLINSVTVAQQFTNGGAWTINGWIGTANNQVFAYAAPDPNLTATGPIAAGGMLNLVQLTVSYNNTTTQPRRIRVRSYAAPPAEVPVLSVDGGIKAGRDIAQDILEEEVIYEYDAEEIPTTTDTGQAILVVLLMLAGILAASRYWRHQVQ
jgi:hypothetical protein